MPALNLGVDEVLTTTRSVRKRLDLDRPVPRAVIDECLSLALQAPSAANTQGWQWIFVENPATKESLAEIYRANLSDYAASAALPDTPNVERADRSARSAESGRYLVEHLHEVPVLLIPCQRGRVDETAPGAGATFWASLLPAVWNFCLALRSRGLGSCWTTLHLFGDGERAAAELVGIPYDDYSQAGLIPIAYTKGTEFRPAKRLAPDDVTRWDRW